MSLKDLTDKQIKELHKSLGEQHNFESGILARLGMWLDGKMDKAAIKRAIELQARAAVMNGLENLDKDIEHRNALKEKQRETELLAEDVKKKALENENDEYIFQMYEREIKVILMRKAAQHSMDLPTYLKVIENQLSLPRDGNMEQLIGQVKAGLASEQFRSHMAIEMLRHEIAGLYTQRLIVEETEKDEKTKKKKMKDIDDQIKAYKEDKKQRERGLVQIGERGEEPEGSDEDTPSDPRVRG